MIILMCYLSNNLSAQHLNKFCDDIYRFTPDSTDSGPNPCDPPIEYVPFLYSYSSQIPTSTLAGGNYYLTQDLTINSNFTFLSCKLKFAPGVKITINSSKKLNLQNCHLFSCTLLWKGISVDNNSNLTSYNTLIEDAEKAIFNDGPINSCVLSVELTTFNKDIYGIHLSSISQVYGGQGTPVIAKLVKFRKNNFLCNGYIKGTNDITTAGIYLKNVSFIINIQVGESNRSTFSGIKNGIITEGNISPLKISYFNFTDIRMVGIQCENAFISQSKYLNFLNCKNGIKLFNTFNFELEGSHFIWDALNTNPGNKLGLQFSNIKDNATLLFKQNEVLVHNTYISPQSNYITGLYFDRTTDLGQPYIIGANVSVSINTNSFFNYSSSGLLCIDISTPDIPPTVAHFFVDNNLFVIQNYYSSVINSYGNRNKFEFTENDIYTVPGGDFGNTQLMTFYASTGFQNEISNNTVHPHPDFPFTYWNAAYAAFTFSDFSNSLVCNNTSSENNREFVFEGKCQMTEFRRNTARSGRLLELNNFPIISDQVHAGNIYLYGNGNWTPTVDIPGGTFEKKYSAVSRFTVHEEQSTSANPKYYHPEFIDPLYIPGTNELWWNVKPDGTPGTCASVRGVITSLDFAILENTGVLDLFLPEELYLIKLYLYHYLLENSDYKNLDVRFVDWMNYLSDTTQIDEMVNIHNAMNSGYSSVAYNSNSIGILHTIDSLLSLSYTDYDQDSMSASFNYNLGVINSQLNNLQDVQSVYDYERSNYYAQILNSVNGITPENSAESLILTYYKIYLELVSGIPMSQNQLEDLIEIASSCPRKFATYPAWANNLLPECQQLPGNQECNPPQQISRVILHNKALDGIYNLLGQKLCNHPDELRNSGFYIQIKNGVPNKIYHEANLRNNY